MKYNNDSMKIPIFFWKGTLISTLIVITGFIANKASLAQFNEVDDIKYAISDAIPKGGDNQIKAALVDIAIYYLSCSDFEVRLKPNVDILSNTLTNIQFTMKWPANTVDFINLYSDYNVEIQGPIVIENDTNFAVFVSTSPIPINWFSEIEYTILSFSHDQSSLGYINLIIDTGEWANSNNGTYYVELLGIDETGVVYQNALNIFLETCGRLDIKAFLQGPYISSNGLMETTINDASDLTLDQPYSGPPWNYNGIESVISMPDDVVDWILVELHDAPNAGSTSSATSIDRQAALLLDNGSIVDLDGTSSLKFNNTLVQNLFVTLWHRNHLGILSAFNIVDAPPDIYSYDFASGSSQAFGSGQIFLGSGTYGMISGDSNSDGIIDLLDMTQVWILTSGNSGYLKGDMNLDRQVDNKDKNDLWYNNLLFETQVPN